MNDTMNIATILSNQAAAQPHAPAIIDTYRGKERVTTFAQLERLVAQAVTLLRRSNLHPGDAVLVLHPMSLELYVALLALFRLRLVAMFLDPSAGRGHIARCCELGAPRGFIAGWKAHLLRLVCSGLRKIPVQYVVDGWAPGIRWQRLTQTTPDTEPPQEGGDAPALLTFTSGSTGQPKAAVRTHRFLLAQRDALQDTLELGPGDVDLTTMPIVLLVNLACGVTSLIPNADLRRPGNVDSEPIFAQMLAHRPTSCVASPAFFERLLSVAGGESQFTSFRRVFTGGAPVFPRLLDQLQSACGEARIFAVYGSTEAEPIAHIARDEIEPSDLQAMHEGAGLLTGAPTDHVRLAVIDDAWGTPLEPMSQEQFRSRTLPAGKAGEIVVHGAHVLKGYLHGKGDAETKFRVDGEIWHRTGDAGYLDSRGRLWLLGRAVATVRDEAGTLYPFAAECAVSVHPEVRRSAAFAHNGKRLLAIEPATDGGPVDTQAVGRELEWARFDEIRVVDRIPVDSRHNAKVDYTQLKRALGLGERE